MDPQFVQWQFLEGMTCAAMLALMALVRGDSPSSSANRWRLVQSGGLAAVLALMTRHAARPMVQLSGLLILVPLSLEDEHLQGQVAAQGLPAILAALKTHIEVEEVVGKALLALGALAQGDRDGVIDRMMAGGLPRVITRAIVVHGTTSEEVLWAALFVLAVVAREACPNYSDRVVALAAAGIRAPLAAAVEAHRSAVPLEMQVEEGGDMVATAGVFVLELLDSAGRLLVMRRLSMVMGVVTFGVVAFTGLRAYRQVRGAAGRPSRSSGRP